MLKLADFDDQFDVYDVSSLIPNEQSQNHQAPDQDQ
jgi:hypothetical protein